MINRGSFEPAYLQLIHILRDQISQGIFRPGDRLPSESQLCKQYEVSPMTVRRVINALIEQGVVRTTQGKGTFVRPLQLSTVTFGLEQFQRLLTEGAGTQVRILEARIVKADERIAQKLNIPAGTRTIHIRRLLSQSAERLIHHHEHLIYDPHRPVVESEMEVAALHGLFSGGEVTDLKWGALTVSAAILSEEEAVILGATPGSPVFHLEHIFHDYDDKPVSWGIFVCRGDRFAFTATVGHFDGSSTSAATGGR
jgi:GntR family transcriptional regulator